MADLIRGLDADRVRAAADGVRAEIADACARVGRDPSEVELLAAVKYVAIEELPVLAAAGVTVLGENRAQELERKARAWEEQGLGPVTWDFIGHLQSRKVRGLAPLVRRIHSVGSDSALRELGKLDAPVGVLVEVNIAREEGKSGIDPQELPAFLARCPLPVSGLMTMPPLADDPQESRPWFAALAALAREHGLRELSMGTTQDFAIAVEEGATVVRVGTRLYR
ncbi:YggS family pyridoxal phosphate-dependent enzyme [Conexibacter sp. W3-3-2]|uniref:YggS family pyridoxal phosphate-dependent enzyme n=1 Tax=Conexibacter sp. W3-3-2 TaxID=2675227 RepID=UPI0012B9E21E|nr:YggS family pyridoxal phosphate-dependent enzyme [Conexibacter sp. W3-3-2]MTD43328.1 YggS family pyridoxal phosphate-dependent enzyme [Conexibacter sp. W3-3-2]